MPGLAALLRQQPGNQGTVILGGLQQPAGQLQLGADVGIIVGGAAAAVRPYHSGKLLDEQAAGAPFGGGKGQAVAGHPVNDDLGQGAVTDAVKIDAEGLLHMGNGALQVILGFGLGGAGRLDVQFIVPAAVACGDIQMRALVQPGNLLRHRELIQLQHPHGGVAYRTAAQLGQQRPHRGGEHGGKLARKGRQRQQQLPAGGDGIALHQPLLIRQRDSPGGEGGEVGQLFISQGKPHAGGPGLQLPLQRRINGGGAFQSAAHHPQRRGNGSRLRRKQQNDRFALAGGGPQGGKQLGGLRAADGIGKLRRKVGGFFFEVLVGGIKGGLILRLAADGKNGDLHGLTDDLLCAGMLFQLQHTA